MAHASREMAGLRRDLWLAALLTIYTGWDYLNAGIRHLVEVDETAP